MEIGILSFSELALRVGLATIAGMALGFDREARGFPAGIRTNALVSLSSAAITISALMLYSELTSGGAADIDPLRVVQGLAQAIGFIAAGVIFTSGRDVLNLTSAANLWLSAAVGIACGAAQFELAALSVGIGIFLLVVVRFLERFFLKSRKPEN